MSCGTNRDTLPRRIGLDSGDFIGDIGAEFSVFVEEEATLSGVEGVTLGRMDAEVFGVPAVFTSLA